MQNLNVKLPGPYSTVYICNKEDDLVATHTHTYPHSCTVLSGSVLAACEDKEKILKVGQSVMFPAFKPHSIKPLSVGTIFVNSTNTVEEHEKAAYTVIDV
jgi:quercetin dioxygenase-like cupin family protein